MLRKALDRGSFTAKGNLESGRRLVHRALSKIKGHRNKVSLLEGIHNRDLEGGGSFTGDLERYVKALKMGVCFHRAPLLGTWRDACFLGSLRKRKKILFRGIFMKVSRDMQKCHVNRYLSP